MKAYDNFIQNMLSVNISVPKRSERIIREYDIDHDVDEITEDFIAGFSFATGLIFREMQKEVD